MEYADSVRAGAALRLTFAAAIVAAMFPLAGPAQARLGDCGQILSEGELPLARDSLFVLQAAVQIHRCDPECICDVDGSGGIEATDALRVLSRAVGLELELRCRCNAVVTSSTTSSTATSSTSSTSSTSITSTSSSTSSTSTTSTTSTTAAPVATSTTLTVPTSSTSSTTNPPPSTATLLCHPDQRSCDDGIACTDDDRCVFGACVGTDACADDPFASCDIDSGQCVALPAQPAPATSFLTRKGEGSEALACAYYNLIDPMCQDLDCDGTLDDPSLPCKRSTLGGWWESNGFDPADGSGTDVERAFYLNHNDLGFGREMNCRRTRAGCVACYVTNYGGADQHPANAELALAADPAAAIATVTMEYCPVKEFDELGPITRFFVYGNGTAGSGRDPRSPRESGADLDGFGVKFVPNLCFNCHGGDTRALEAELPADLTSLDLVAPDGKLLADAHAARTRLLEALTRTERSSFLPFDLASLRYPAALERAVQEPAFKVLNELVLESEPAPAIEELIEGWYRDGDAAVQLDDFVPEGWRAATTGEAFTEELYTSVIAPTCRSCHVALLPPFDLARYSDFMTAYDFSNVCGPSRDMPHAFATYKSFWVDRGRQLFLADHLLRTGRSVAGCASGFCNGGPRSALACIDDTDCPGGDCLAGSGAQPPLPITTTTTVVPPTTLVPIETTSTSTSSTSSSTTPASAALTWTQIQAVFAETCDGVGCHTAEFASGGLGNLDDTDAGYDNLIGAPVLCAPPGALTQLVVPGDPGASFLLAKLDGTFDCGLPMPLLAAPLGADVIAGIQAWIAEGAPKN